jgi:hypothetical protein
MKHILLSLAMGFIISSIAIAHEEPAKTLKEKKDKEEKAAFYRSKNVASYTVWKHQISENKPDTDKKEKFLTTLLDEHGNISEMLVYKNTDTLEYRVVFSYDKHNNMTGDTDFNPDGSVNENIKYKYFEGTSRFSEIIKKSPEDQALTTTVYSLNEQGLVNEVTTRDAEGNLTSFSEYTYEFKK